MPTTASPSHYERSTGDAAQTYDQTDFFRCLEIDHLTWTGNVESPLGAVTLHHVTFADLVDYLPSDATLADLADLGVEPGWYLVKTDSNGLIWAMTYGQSTFGEESARADYATCEAVHVEWDSEVDDY